MYIVFALCYVVHIAHFGVNRVRVSKKKLPSAKFFHSAIILTSYIFTFDPLSLEMRKKEKKKERKERKMPSPYDGHRATESGRRLQYRKELKETQFCYLEHKKLLCKRT